MAQRIYPADLPLDKANQKASDTNAAFLDLNLSFHDETVSTKINKKRDDFDFNVVNGMCCCLSIYQMTVR